MASQQSHDEERLLERSDASDAMPEESYHRPATYSSQRPWNRSFPWILNVLLTITTITLSLQLLRGDRYQHTGDINNLAPRFTQRIQLFHPSKAATAAVGHPDQKKVQVDYWRTFAPDGFGLINLKDWTPERYPDLATPTIEEFGEEKFNLVDTSMAHQLHCLHSILEAYNEMAMKVNGTAVSGMGGMEMPKNHDHSWHLGHCFDYIRQGIMCCGDTALEGAATTFPDGVKGSDGWNAKHVCKDYEEVKSWVIGMGP